MFEQLFRRIADPNDPYGNVMDAPADPPAKPLPGAPSGASQDGPLFNPPAPQPPAYPMQGEYNPAFDGLEDDGEDPEVWIRSPEGSMHRRRREDVQSLPPGWTRAPMRDPEVTIRTPEGAHFRVPRSMIGTGEGQWPPELVVPNETAPNAHRLYAPPARSRRPLPLDPVQPGFNGDYGIPVRPQPGHSTDETGEGPIPASPGVRWEQEPGQYPAIDPSPYPRQPGRRQPSQSQQQRWIDTFRTANGGVDPTEDEIAQMRGLGLF